MSVILAPVSLKTLYDLIVVSLVLIPASYCLGVLIVRIFVDNDDIYTDGWRLFWALIVGLICKFMIYVVLCTYGIIVIKVIQGILYYEDVANSLIVVPLLPITVVGAICWYKKYKIKKLQRSYTISDYVAEVKELKERYSHEVNGEKAIEPGAYIAVAVAMGADWLIARLHFNSSQRKNIVVEAIPLLMKDLESDKLCYCRYYDGSSHYLCTTIDYWEYLAESKTIVVKFSHEAKARKIKVMVS